MADDRLFQSQSSRPADVLRNPDVVENCYITSLVISITALELRGVSISRICDYTLLYNQFVELNHLLFVFHKWAYVWHSIPGTTVCRIFTLKLSL